jgi:hypothetical protein
MGERRLVLSLASMLPLTLVGNLLGGLRRAALRAGCTDLTMDSALQMWATLPVGGEQVEHHEILLRRSSEEQGMVEWSCSCAESSPRTYRSVAGAAVNGIEHVRPGEDWTMVPHHVLWSRPDEMDV